MTPPQYRLVKVGKGNLFHLQIPHLNEDNIVDWSTPCGAAKWYANRKVRLHPYQIADDIPYGRWCVTCRKAAEEQGLV